MFYAIQRIMATLTLNHMIIYDLKKLWLLLAICLLSISANGSTNKVYDKHYGAYKYKINNLWYIISSDKATAIASEGPYEGTSYDGDQYIGDIIIPEKVSIGDIEYPVSAVGSNFHIAAKGVTSIKILGTAKINTGAFSSCNELTSVQLSATTTTISNNAFSSCTNLKKVTYNGGPTTDGLHLPPTVKAIEQSAFSNCKILLPDSYTLPANITELGVGTFSKCESLVSFTFPERTKITNIPSNLFNECTNLKSITYSTAFKAIGNRAFANCPNFYRSSSFKLPDGLTSLGENAFENCGVKEVNATKTKLTKIPASAFSNCSNLTNISFPNTLTIIDSKAFQGCKNLIGGISKLLNIPLNVTKIGDYAFNGCPAFTAVTIQKNVETIGNGAFKDCSGLAKINFSEGDNKTTNLKTIGKEAFANCTSLEHLILPNSIGSLSQSAFSGCSRLSEISFYYSGQPTLLKTISSNAFSQCTNLSTASFPEGIAVIESSAFEGCKSLTRADFPQSLEKIEAQSFQNCIGLKEATAYDVRIIEINDLAFAGAGITKWEIKSRATDHQTPSRGQTPSKGLILGKDVFASCTQLELLPENIISFDEGAFYNCKSLKSLTLKIDGSTEIKRSAFEGMFALHSIILPNTIRSIGQKAFRDCKTLTNINLPDSLRIIDTTAFDGCSSLKSVSCPDSINEIRSYAFVGCPNLQSLSFGTKEWDNDRPDERILKIGKSAFSNSDKITSITSYFAIPPELQNSFSYIYSKAVVSVPYGSLQAYKQDANWKNFTNIVERAPLSSINQIETNKITNIHFNNGNLIINCKTTLPIQIYSVDGRLIFNGLSSDRIPQLTTGIYIVRAENSTYKLINKWQ